MGQPTDIGSFDYASPMGVYDLAGNAWEWTRDWYRSDYYCDPTVTGQFTYPNCNGAHVWRDPVGDEIGTLKGLRGGSWFHPAQLMRNAERQGLEPSMASNLIGFRCAR